MTSTASFRLRVNVLVLCSFIVLNLTAFATDRIAQVKYFNTENDLLKHNSVETVVRDSMGYIWVGTNYGLNRLDGYRTVNYIHLPDDSTSISDSHVKDLFVDSKGRLWIGTIGGGLNRFDYTGNTFVRYPLIESQSGQGLNVPAIVEDHEGFIWVGIVGEGLCRLDPETGEVGFYEISRFHPDFQRSSNISNLLCDCKGNIWVGFDFDQNGIYKLDPHNDQITFHGLTADTDDYLEVGPVMGIDEMADGTLLFTIWNGKLFKLNPKVDRHIQLVYGPEFFNHANLTGLTIDQNQNIWITSWDHGLFMLGPDYSLINNYQRDQSNTHSLSSNAINDLYADHDQLWVSTREQGLNLLSLQPRMFEQIDPSSVSAFREIDAHRLVSDGKGNIWIGTRGQGLWKYQTKSKKLKHYSKEKYPGLINENILSLHLDQNGLLWMGTDGKFTGIFDPENETFNFVPHFEGVWNSVYSLA
ncbi:MAG: hypothetical protein JXR22_12520, partial [Prolixibacteraceae bacterium]|nr:hypothetical protein [Prolixibacteraceae bacterium]